MLTFRGIFRQHLYKSKREIVLALGSASSGIASLLLPRGQTSHSIFSILLTIARNAVEHTKEVQKKTF